MLRVERHLEVPRELEAALLWYESERPGLGTEFLDEYKSTLQRILDEPKRWRKFRGEIRKLNFHRFPYAIVYRVFEEEIYIMAVMHLRRPGYWAKRRRVD